MNGKGDARRPAAVEDATVAANWARAFGQWCACAQCVVQRESVAAQSAVTDAALRRLANNDGEQDGA